MNKMMKWGLVSLLSLAVSGQAMAAFVLNGTRFIYEEGRKNTSFEVTNQADETFGGQVWIDNTTQGSSTVYMVPAPPFFKVRPKEKQIIRIMKTDSTLPSDRDERSGDSAEAKGVGRECPGGGREHEGEADLPAESAC